MDLGRQLFSYEGRSGRQSFWIAWLILFVAGLILGLIPVINLIAFFVLLYPRICIYSTRLHDMGKSAFLQIIPYAVTATCLILSFILFGANLFNLIRVSRGVFSDEAAAMTMLGSLGGFLGLMGLSGLVSLGFLLWVGCTPSQPGPNQYGEGPDGAPSVDVF